MVAALLRDAGLNLGPDDDLMPASPDNENGFWENLRFVELNDELLGALGAGWDEPPATFASDDPALGAARVKAEALAHEFEQLQPWGWKDPRTTLLLPFWLELFPDLRIVGCVRNPLEVALSLHRRSYFSYERGLSLWLEYNERLLTAAPRSQLLLTHYDAYFADPVDELRRVLTHCGIEAPGAKLEEATATARHDLRHNRFSCADLLAAEVSSDVIELYAQLCEESVWSEQDAARLRDAGRSRRGQGARGQLNRAVVDAEVLRREVKALQGVAETRGSALEHLRGRIADLEDEVAAAGGHLAEREQHVEQLSEALGAAQAEVGEVGARLAQREAQTTAFEQTVRQLRAQVDELRAEFSERIDATEEAATALELSEVATEELRARVAWLEGRLADRDALDELLAEFSERIDATEEAATARELSEVATEELRARVAWLEGRLADRDATLVGEEETLAATVEGAVRRLHAVEEAVGRFQGSTDDALARLHNAVERVEGALAMASPLAPEKVEYARLREQIRTAIADVVPFDATVLVASKGDDALLELAGRRAWHFPRTLDGSYPWHYPGDSGSAIAHLEALKAQGADYLLLPAPSLWWLTYYAGFRQHLERCYRRVSDDKQTCVVFSLREPPVDADKITAAVGGVLGELDDRLRPSPAILDLATAPELDLELTANVVFSPPERTSALPYLDRSVDIVVVREPDVSTLAEAHRVASSAVVVMGGTDAVEVEWIEDTEASLPRTSIVIATRNGLAATDRCLAALSGTVPKALDVEFVVVDDARDGKTAAALKRRGKQEERLRVVRNGRKPGVLASRNRGAKAATGELVLFLDCDSIPISGWLQPLLRTFRTHPNAGVVGAKLAFPDGRLQAAGGVVFSDGGVVGLGEGDYHVDAPLYCHTRDVDYCVGALLATQRSLFLELGGFDSGFPSGSYADVDYCFKVWQAGRDVLYQPQSLVVHPGGDGSGGDARAAGLAAFTEKWVNALESRHRRPARLDAKVWHELAVREPWEAAAR
jgi:GT2 family glycosyltransferase